MLELEGAGRLTSLLHDLDTLLTLILVHTRPRNLLEQVQPLRLFLVGNGRNLPPPDQLCLKCRPERLTLPCGTI